MWVCSEALRVELHSVEQQRAHGVSGSTPFEEIYEAGLKALGLELSVCTGHDAVERS